MYNHCQTAKPIKDAVKSGQMTQNIHTLTVWYVTCRRAASQVRKFAQRSNSHSISPLPARIGASTRHPPNRGPARAPPPYSRTITTRRESARYPPFPSGTDLHQ